MQDITLLEKVEKYFFKKYAGHVVFCNDSLIPSDLKQAFIARQNRYLYFTNCSNWKGPTVDFYNPFNVRSAAKEDLAYARLSAGYSAAILDGLGAETFTGTEDKADFYQRVNKIKKDYHDAQIKAGIKINLVWDYNLNTYSKEELLYMTESMEIDQQKLVQQLRNFILSKEKGLTTTKTVGLNSNSNNQITNPFLKWKLDSIYKNKSFSYLSDLGRQK